MRADDLSAGPIMSSCTRLSRTALAACLFTALGAAGVGCSIPEYKEPKGFSSTFHGRLYGPPAVRPEIPEPVPPLDGDPLLQQGSRGAPLSARDWTQGNTAANPQAKRYPIAETPPGAVR